jgi:septal ring factor EnvC (AmiA/AmiB activator)
MKTTLAKRRQHLQKQLAQVERKIVETEQRLRHLEVQMARATQERATAA